MSEWAATPPSQGAAVLAVRRIMGLVLRHLYLVMGSWPRLVELTYWPTVQIILWGFITQFLVGHSSFIAQAFGVLIAAVILWDIMFRSQLGFAIAFLEEMWSRNLGHLFVSPLRPQEFVIALMCLSLVRTLIGVIPATLLAIAFFGFNVYSLGFSLIGFFINLVVMGWSVGLVVCGVILRFGLGAESLAWAVMFALAPICGIYYPITVMPEWVQLIAHGLPATYVFEGMRAIIVDGEVRTDLLITAALINVVFVAVGMAVFLAFFRTARRRGQLLQIGE